MDIPLLIAILSILALLAWTLLPGLDQHVDVEAGADRPRSYLRRLARWSNE